MNRSFSQDSTAANAKQRQESAAVNGAASGGRSKKLAIGGGSMSRSLVQESTSADRRSIDESLALIQHHVQVGSFFLLCSCTAPTLPLFTREFFYPECVLIYVYGGTVCITALQLKITALSGREHNDRLPQSLLNCYNENSYSIKILFRNVVFLMI